MMVIASDKQSWLVFYRGSFKMLIDKQEEHTSAIRPIGAISQTDRRFSTDLGYIRHSFCLWEE